MLGYLVFVPWSAMGFYDGAAVLLLLLGFRALQRDRRGRALLWGALSLLLHFRALWYAPLFVAVAWTVWRDSNRPAVESEPASTSRPWIAWLTSPSDRTLLLVGGALVLPALLAFLTVMPHLKHFPVNNPLNYRLLSFLSPATWSLLLLTAGGIALLAARRHWLLLAQLLWCELVIVQAPQAQPWHLMFLWPMVLLPCASDSVADASRRQEQVTLALVWVVLLTAVVFVSPLDVRWVVSILRRFGG